MRTIYLKYALLPLAAAVVCGCTVREPEKRTDSGTGITVLRDAVEAVEDYAGFANAAFAAKVYSRATTEEKISLENSLLFGYSFRPIDDIWEVSTYEGRYYTAFETDADEEVTGIKITRSRNYTIDGEPVFDLCYLERRGESLWALEIDKVKNSSDYYAVREGEGFMELEITGFVRGLPDSFIFSGGGKYSSVRHDEDVVEVSWSIPEGLMECFSRMMHYNHLRKAEMEIDAGKPGSAKDMIVAIFDRSRRRLELTVNGIEEDAHPYF